MAREQSGNSQQVGVAERGEYCLIKEDGTAHANHAKQLPRGPSREGPLGCG